MKLRITINIPESCPSGTALLFAFSDLIKDVPSIVDLVKGKRMKSFSYMDQGEISMNISRIE